MCKKDKNHLKTDGMQLFERNRENVEAAASSEMNVWNKARHALDFPSVCSYC